jgi:PD-(D/E)XK nuclease superfamily
VTDTRTKISWSSLQRFEACHQKYYLISEGKSLPGRDVRNFLAGNIVDSAQKAWLDNPVGNIVDTIDYHMDKAIAKAEEKDTIKWRNKNDKAGILSFCKEVAVDLQPILEARVLPYDYEPGKWFQVPVKIKNPITDQVEEIVLRGEFDLLVKEKDNRFVVWDLKTTKDNDYWKKTLGQLVFYDLVIMAMFNEYPKKTGLIQPACDEQVKEFYFEDSHRAEMWGRINSMMNSVWKGEFDPKQDNVGCSFCEVAHACSKYKRKLFS